MSPFPVKTCILCEGESKRNKHPHREWGSYSTGMQIPTRNEDALSPGMHILTDNADVTHREYTSLPGIHMFIQVEYLEFCLGARNSGFKKQYLKSNQCCSTLHILKHM